jgi:hypothetical protein
MNKVISRFFLTLCVLAAPTFADSPWELDKEDKDRGINVYTRDVDGSALREFKGTMTIKSSLTAFVALLNDVSRGVEWMHKCAHFEIVDQPKPYISYSYAINGAPWPVTDRDMYILSKVSQKDDLTVTVSIESLPKFGAENDDYVRIQSMNGFWSFSPAQDGFVDVTYQILADPGGSLPSWVANMVVVDTPYYTLKAMQKIILEPKYQQATLNYISNETKVDSELVPSEI